MSFNNRETSTGAFNRVVDTEAPTGAIDGNNVTFTLVHAPNPTSSLKVILNGQVQLLNTDYTIVSATITFTNPPEVGQWIDVSYRY